MNGIRVTTPDGRAADVIRFDVVEGRIVVVLRFDAGEELYDTKLRTRAFKEKGVGSEANTINMECETMKTITMITITMWNQCCALSGTEAWGEEGHGDTITTTQSVREWIADARRWERDTTADGGYNIRRARTVRKVLRREA